MKRILGNKGFSLIELLTVVALIVVIMAIATPSFVEWMTRYNVEAQVRQIYGDLNNARTQAMYRNRTHFIGVISATSYQVIDDANEDGVVNDAAILTRNVTYPMVTSAGLIPFSFNGRGMSSVAEGATGAVCVPSNVSPSYDCIRIGQARIQLGRMMVQGGGCDEIICRAN